MILFCGEKHKVTIFICEAVASCMQLMMQRGSLYKYVIVMLYLFKKHCWYVCYPPFASIAKGEVFVLLYVCFLPAIR